MASLSPPTIPEAIQSLLDQAEFLASIEEDHKPCLASQTHVPSDSWWSWFQRRYNQENSEKTKLHIRKVCTDMAQTYTAYKGTIYGNIILSSMLRLRVGLQRLVVTYSKIVAVRGHINNSIITLDLCIPADVKTQHGIGSPSSPQGAESEVKAPAIPLPATATPPATPPGTPPAFS